MKHSSNQKLGKLQGVIAEIGNHHMGEFDKAKKLIQYAQAAGASFVKMQAIEAEAVIPFGSMPKGFYERAEMSNSDYEKCVDYGRKIGIPVFFSIFGEKPLRLLRKFPNNYYKISGGQFNEWGPTKLKDYNRDRTIVSLPSIKAIKIEKAAAIQNMQKMFVSKYLDEKPALNNISIYKTIFGENIGYSDHTKGLDACKSAIQVYGSRLIEKHFHLGDDIEFEGVLYRDCLHASTPQELHELCEFLKGYTQ